MSDITFSSLIFIFKSDFVLRCSSCSYVSFIFFSKESTRYNKIERKWKSEYNYWDPITDKFYKRIEITDRILEDTETDEAKEIEVDLDNKNIVLYTI